MDSRKTLNIIRKNRALSFFALSLVIHFLSVFIFNFDFLSRFKAGDTAKTKSLPISRVDANVAQKILDQIKQQKNSQPAKQQIVNSNSAANDKKPENSRFLGAKDQTFDRETIAKKVEIFKDAGKGVDTGLADEATDSPKVQKKSERAENKPVKKALSLKDLGAGIASQVAESLKQADLHEEQKQAEAAGPKAGLTNGREDLRGMASNNDFIEDVRLGDVTNLNTVEFKYFGFYQRIRSKLEQHWGRTLREKAKALYSSGRKLASGENYITSVIVTINEKGSITKVHIKGASGHKELDDAAIESFNKAGPFPNPPKGMLEGRGEASIEWGFVVRS